MTATIQVIVLCGGYGRRMGAADSGVPKPLQLIGGRPILWHVLNGFARDGFKEFILCLGHRKEDFLRYFDSNFQSVDLSENSSPKTFVFTNQDNWKITLVETGEDSQTGARIGQVENLISSDDFFVSYADDLSDLDFKSRLQAHRDHGTIASLTSVQPISSFGILEIDGHHVKHFNEKPKLPYWVNAGFYVFHREVFDLLRGRSDLENDVLPLLAQENQLSVYKYSGFWMSVNTPKELFEANVLWNEQPRMRLWNSHAKD